MEHLRYPEDLYKVQRQILGKYHMTDPAVWYQENDLWEVPVDPVGGNSSKVPPYYLSVRWPAEQEDNFALTSIYVPSNRSNLAAFMAVNADASSENYGQMRVLRMSDSQQTDGPGQVFAAMTNDATVADTLLRFQNAGTAQVSYGNLLTLPVGGGLLNVMPVYVQRQASTGSYPALQFVIVRFGSTVAIDPTLQGPWTRSSPVMPVPAPVRVRSRPRRARAPRAVRASTRPRWTIRPPCRRSTTR